jgi:hypothetical protein
VDTLVWASVGFCLAAGLVGTVVLVRAGLLAWRDIRRAIAAGQWAVEDLVGRANATVDHAEAIVGRVSRLEKSVARLRRSLAALNVVLGGFQEARAVFDGVRAFVPRR